MKKVAVIVAPGFEEGETLTIVDILRRANIVCRTFGLSEVVEGGHAIVLKCDEVLNTSLIDYDMVVLPGGYGGVDAMKKSDILLSLLQRMNKEGKYICAMCAAPSVLEKVNLLRNKKFTAYKGYEEKIKQGHFQEDIVVVDGNIVTGRGPATVYAFAYQLVEILGGDALTIKKRMLYHHAFEGGNDNV